MVVNTPSGRHARADGYEIRAAAVAMDRAIITPTAAATSRRGRAARRATATTSW
jgi:carbamoyl-phosphate synthase large subunit